MQMDVLEVDVSKQCLPQTMCCQKKGARLYLVSLSAFEIDH